MIPLKLNKYPSRVDLSIIHGPLSHAALITVHRAIFFLNTAFHHEILYGLRFDKRLEYDNDRARREMMYLEVVAIVYRRSLIKRSLPILLRNVTAENNSMKKL